MLKNKLRHVCLWKCSINQKRSTPKNVAHKVQLLCLFWFWHVFKTLSEEQTFSWHYCGVKGQSNSLVYMCSTKGEWPLLCSRLFSPLWNHHRDPLTQRETASNTSRYLRNICLQMLLLQSSIWIKWKFKFCTYNNQFPTRICFFLYNFK